MPASKRYDFTESHKDPEFLRASEKGIIGKAKFYRKKLAEAERSGDEGYIFEALYHVIGIEKTVLVRDGFLGSRKRITAAARRMLEVKPLRLQLSLYAALNLFTCGENKLALRLIKHGYKVITDEKSALANVAHLLESKEALLAIHARVNPRSSKTQKAVQIVYGLRGSASLRGTHWRSTDLHLLEAMEELASVPVTTWREAFTREEVLTSLRDAWWLARVKRDVDFSEYISRIDTLLDALPKLESPHRGGPTIGNAKRLP